MILRDAPIQRKLLSVIMLVCLIALLSMSGAYILFEYKAYIKSKEKNLETISRIIASNSSAALAFQSPEDANEILSALKAENTITAACLYDRNGKIFAKYPKDTSSAIFPQPSSALKYEISNGYMSGFEPVNHMGNKLGTLYLLASMREMHLQLWNFAIIGIMFIAGSLIIAFIFTRLLGKKITDPILALEGAAREISQNKDYTVRAVKHSSDEVGLLTDAFNEMLEMIQVKNAEITAFNQKLELKVAERTVALQQQKDFVETIINSSVELIAVFDPELRYMMVNNRAMEFFSFEKDQVIGRKITELFPWLEGSVIHEDLNRALGGEYVHNSRYHSPVSDKYFENYYIPLEDEDNKIYGILTIGHDITNIVQANSQLENLNAELLKSNRDLEQFAYVASHDLQEPLRKIITFSELLASSIHDEEKFNKYYKKISQAAKRMQTLIQDVLNFSRISNADDAFEMTDLNQILENLKNDLELIIQESSAVIKHDPLPTIRAIPLQMTQLFSNLVSNSLKYNKRKPEISITCKKLSAQEAEELGQLNHDRKYFMLKFMDNGIGFESRFNEQIFNIFQRLHGRNAYSGTGIGLALCKKIVENHGGIIYGEGSLDEGAVFTVVLPEN